MTMVACDFGSQELSYSAISPIRKDVNVMAKLSHLIYPCEADGFDSADLDESH